MAESFLEVVPQPTLSSERSRLTAALDDRGTACACCDRPVAAYTYEFDSGLLATLKVMHKCDELRAGEFFHVNDFILKHKLYSQGCSNALGRLRDFGTVEGQVGTVAGKAPKGRWRITEIGRQFIEGRSRIPRTIRTYNERLLSAAGRLSVQEVPLPREFNLQALLVPVREVEGVVFYQPPFKAPFQFEVGASLLADARAALFQNAEVGGYCPVCERKVQFNRYGLNRNMVSVLIEMDYWFRQYRAEWMHVTHELSAAGRMKTLGDWQSLRHWGFIERSTVAGKKAGYYRVTDAGRAFLDGTPVPRYILTYNNELLRSPFGPSVTWDIGA